MLRNAVKLILISIITLCATLNVNAKQSALVANVYGTDIYASDIAPSSREIAHSKRLDEDAATQYLSSVPQQKLSRLIWQAASAEFAKTHDIEPTKAEVQSLIRKMDIAKTNMPQLQDDMTSLSEEEQLQIEQLQLSMYAGIVRNYKLSKALYETYGGIVIFQQLNPLEPVGAYKQYLQEQAAKQNFTIIDHDLKRQFWAYYNQEYTHTIAPNKVDYSQPWWEMTP
jgi:hypothetical protein